MKKVTGKLCNEKIIWAYTMLVPLRDFVLFASAPVSENHRTGNSLPGAWVF